MLMSRDKGQLSFCGAQVFEVAEQNNEHARSVRLCTYTLNTLMQVTYLMLDCFLTQV